MSRRLKSTRQQSTPISLFSFLDILGGTIGILILIISVFFIQLQTGKQIVQMVAETSQIEKKIPRYIVCNGNGLVEIHDDGNSFKANLDSPKIVALLDRIRRSNKREYLIIGVRPSGFQDFKVLRDRAESSGVTLGYEPIDVGWRIRAPGGKLL
jgi:hypothetical protein